MSRTAPSRPARPWTAETGQPIEAVYEQSSLRDDLQEALGRPGEFPFTRHIYGTGYRDRPWAPSLYSGFGTVESANQRFRYLLSQGNGRANIATDLPTQIGLDSDHPDAEGEVGRVGVAIDSLADFEKMFDQVALDETTISFNVNTVAPIFLAMLVATARRQDVALTSLTGTFANDILHEYIARGTWRYPPEASLRLAADVAEFTVREMPKFYPFNIRSILLHEAGAHPGQEIGITFAIACRYIDDLVARGIAVDDVAPHVSFFFGMGVRFLEEAAKFRAARRMWATLVRDRYGTTNPSSLKLRITSVAPCGSHFLAVDPELNLVRGTLGVLAGALGGVQAMLGTTIDEAYDIPTERTQHLALRTQQIVAIESGVCASVDPLGGSFYVESLTDAFEASAREEFAKVGGPEGVVEAILAGGPQAELAERAYDFANQIDQGTRLRVGENIYRPAGEMPEITLHDADLDLHASLTAGLAKLRAGRDVEAVARALDAVRAAAAGSENIVPVLVTAVEAYATVGEISAVLEEAFGEFSEPASQ